MKRYKLCAFCANCTIDIDDDPVCLLTNRPVAIGHGCDAWQEIPVKEKSEALTLGTGYEKKRRTLNADGRTMTKNKEEK